MREDDPRERLIFALDVDNFEEAIRWVRLLKEYVGFFKVGSQLFSHSGPKIIDWIHRQGKEIFLDLKYHDIPNTVARASEEVTKLGVSMLNLHALGGRVMIEKAVEAVHRKAKQLEIPRPKILAVTILTSLNQKDLESLGFAGTLQGHVLALAKIAIDAGVDGVIASPQEISLLRPALGKDFIIVTPGIRLEGSEDDQKRTMTPKEALEAGADYIVLGRIIRKAKDPVGALERLIEEI